MTLIRFLRPVFSGLIVAILTLAPQALRAADPPGLPGTTPAATPVTPAPATPDAPIGQALPTLSGLVLEKGTGQPLEEVSIAIVPVGKRSGTGAAGGSTGGSPGGTAEGNTPGTTPGTAEAGTPGTAEASTPGTAEGKNPGTTPGSAPGTSSGPLEPTGPLSTSTDDRGWFHLELEPGRYRLTFSMPGYLPKTLDTVLAASSQPLPPLFLEPRPDRASAMVVETRRKKKEMSLEVLTRDQIEHTPGTFGDPLKALESLPNVARSGFLQPALVVRGAEPENTAVLLDGHPIPFLYHFNFWKSVINPYFVETIRFYPGGMPSSYGNVLQAVVDVGGREAPLDKVHGVADLNLTDTALVVTAPLSGGKASVAGAFRFSYVSLLVLAGSAVVGASVSEEETSRDTILFPRYSDYSLRVDTTLAGGHLSAWVVGASDAIKLGKELVYIPEEQAALYGIDPSLPYLHRFDQLRVAYRRGLRPDLDLSSSTLLGLDRLVSTIPNLGDAPISIPSEIKIVRPELGERAELTWRARPDLVGIFGIDARFSRAAVTDLANLLFSTDPPLTEIAPVMVAAGYARAEYGRPDGWQLFPEVRGTLYAYNHRIEPRLEPRLTARVPLTSTLVGKAAAGLFSQIPREEEYAYTGNPSLKTMRAVQTSIGAEARLPAGFALESTLFASRLRDLTLHDNREVYTEQNGVYTYELEQVFSIGNGWGYGGEVTLTRPLSERFTGTLSYAYTRSLRESADGLIPGDYDQPHTLTVLGAWNLPRRWVISGRFRLGSGQPYTPEYGAWNPTDHYWSPVNGPTNSGRFPTYHQLDLRLDHTVLHDRWKMDFYLDIQNVYLAKNPILVTPSWNFQGVGGMVWLPLIPSLGWKGEF